MYLWCDRRQEFQKSDHVAIMSSPVTPSLCSITLHMTNCLQHTEIVCHLLYISAPLGHQKFITAPYTHAMHYLFSLENIFIWSEWQTAHFWTPQTFCCGSIWACTKLMVWIWCFIWRWLFGPRTFPLWHLFYEDGIEAIYIHDWHWQMRISANSINYIYIFLIQHSLFGAAHLELMGQT